MIHYRIWAGGGGGYGTTWANGGGGGGEYREGFAAVTPGQVITITVGAGGATGVSATNGGVTSVDSLCTAIGGSHAAGTLGGAGGTGGSGGSFALAGQPGGSAYLGNPYYDTTGLGGGAFGSSAGMYNQTPGSAFPAGGGSGGYPGLGGFVIIEEYGESV
jgi:hypothetical protein